MKFICGEEDLIGEKVVEVVTDKPAINQEMVGVQFYKEFVQEFRSHCSSLGYGLNDVIQQIGIRYGQRVSLEYMTHFEQLKLSRESYTPLILLLNTWIKDTAKAAGSSEKDPLSSVSAPSINPRRAIKRKRTIVSVDVTNMLEKEFAQKKTPTATELQKIAVKLSVEKDHVRTWFSNRRRRERCEGKRPLAKQGSKKDKTAQPKKKVRIPSTLYDITVEVPSVHPRDIGSLIHVTQTTLHQCSKFVFFKVYFSHFNTSHHSSFQVHALISVIGN